VRTNLVLGWVDEDTSRHLIKQMSFYHIGSRPDGGMITPIESTPNRRLSGASLLRLSPAFLLSFFGIFWVPIRSNILLNASPTQSFIIWGQVDEPHAEPWRGHEPVTVYSPSKRNETVAICLIVRNETVYMDEWVDFHIALGFAPIFIYDNADLPDLVLENWYERRTDIQQYVRIIHMPSFPVQVTAYKRCIREDAQNFTFVAMIDIDEFIVLKKHDNIVDFMVEHCDEECGQITLNWRQMGTSNETKYRPLPVTKRNVNVHTFTGANKVVKAIVRPTYVSSWMDWSHTVMLKKGFWVDTNGTRIPRVFSTNKCCNPHHHRGPTDVGEIYHYKFKSEEEFYVKSCVRGDSLLPRGVMTKCGHMHNPGNLPRNGGEFDDSAWKQLKRFVPKYAIFDRMTDVSLY